jgi:hypothetical protein
MARSAFAEVIQLQLDRFGPEEAKAKHIEIARAGLAKFLGTQQSKPSVLIEVDGRQAANENEVKPYGIITYRFMRMQEIVAFAMAKAREFSPVGTAQDARPGHPGLYRDSWFALVDGYKVNESDIGANDAVTITNNQPYSRKINTGARGFERYAPPGVVEKVRQAVLKKYGAVVEAHIIFLDLADSYVLKRDLRHIFKGRRYGGARRDARAGMAITYPAVIIEPKQFGTMGQT